jgi:hypothetical protein
LKIDFDD